MSVLSQSLEELQALESELAESYQNLRSRGLKLDMTRGKPSAEQVMLSDSLDGVLGGNYRSASGEDTRNYGNLRGIDEMRALGGALLGVPAANVIAAGNSSLTLMYLCMVQAAQIGSEQNGAWNKVVERPRMICPAPGYDRHFRLCEHLGVDMVTVDMDADGPDMDAVEALVRGHEDIVGLWCVPKYSNPTGVVYSEETVDRIARLGAFAQPWFRVLYDNAYAVHGLGKRPAQLTDIWKRCQVHGTLDSVWQFASTSKISFAGGGVSFVAGSDANLADLEQLLGVMTIGFDKVNQLRHARLFPDLSALETHMRKHAEILRPKFAAVEEALQSELSEYGHWNSVDGGYFVSFDTHSGVAAEVVRLAADAGVKLTPAGATFPYGHDPQDRNIRIAPSMPPLDEVRQAMEVFVVCVQLATVRRQLADS